MATLIPPQELLGLYAGGWFPMAMPDGSLRCFSPDPRGIIPLDGFHVPHGSKKVLRDPAWVVRQDTAFEEVVRACADRDDTWINDEIEESYGLLHMLGHAHSVEVWEDGELVGGLYGVNLARAFFGESMFSRRTDASKVALAWLVARMKVGGFTLLDCQFMTDHLRSLGAIEITQERYLQLLSSALGEGAGGVGDGAGAFTVGGASSAGAATFDALDRLLAARSDPAGEPPSGWVIAQLIGQTS